MRCPICKTAELPENGLLQAVCDGCMDAELPKKHRPNLPEVAFVSRPKRRRKPVKEAGPPPTPVQTIESARAVARAWRTQVSGHGKQATPTQDRTLRFDTAHRFDNALETSPETTQVESRNRLKSIRGSVNFGLFVLLAGQALMLAAHWSQHSTSWFIGLLLSIGGLTQSILSLNEGLRQIEERFASLTNTRSKSKSD